MKSIHLLNSQMDSFKKCKAKNPPFLIQGEQMQYTENYIVKTSISNSVSYHIGHLFWDFHYITRINLLLKANYNSYFGST